MYRVEGRENKKAKKNEKERSKEKKIGMVLQKKKKKNFSKFWLMRMRQSEILYIFTRKSHKKSYYSVRKCISSKVKRNLALSAKTINLTVKKCFFFSAY